jgi:hypothetical protein
MSYKARTLYRLIEDMNKSLFLPHIQRPFVWEEDQMVRLFDSLMRGYPIQTFLFWRTKDAIKARKFMGTVDWDAELHLLYDENVSAQGVEKVFVLDGQQRLQTLYALFNGMIKSSNEKNNLEAYVDVTAGDTVLDGDLLFRVKFSREDPGLPYYRLRNLRTIDEKRTGEDLADKLNDALDAQSDESSDVRKAREKRVRSNCSKLVSLLREEIHFWVEELDGTADDYPYKKVLDIFVRVNSGGTKLDASDLMFAAMKESWAPIEENIEDVVTLLNGTRRLQFDKSFVLKCLAVVHGFGAELSPEKLATLSGQELLDKIEANWSKAEDTFQQLRDFVENDLHLYGGKMVRSYVSFVPLFDYLFNNPRPAEQNKVMMKAYYYKSQLLNWYAAQTDNILDALHIRVGKRQERFPIGDIKTYFEGSRRAESELTENHLSNMRLRFIVLNLVYVARHGGSPFNVASKGNEPHIDHIYPQSKLRKDLGLDTADINHMGNYRFVGAAENIRKRAELPAPYFSRLQQSGVDIQNHLLLASYSAAPSLLSFDEPTYMKFRDQRLTEIYNICSNVVNAELAVAEA